MYIQLRSLVGCGRRAAEARRPRRGYTGSKGAGGSRRFILRLEVTGLTDGRAKGRTKGNGRLESGPKQRTGRGGICRDGETGRNSLMAGKPGGLF